VQDEFQKRLVIDVCQSEAYTEHTIETKNFCIEQLAEKAEGGTGNRRTILRRFEGEPLEETTVPDRKIALCTNLLKECPLRKTNPVPISKCQACMEAFETLDFTMRRDSETVKFGGSDPFASRKKKAVAAGFGSSFHAEIRMNELCTDLHLHFKLEALEEVQEVCEDVVSDYPDEVKRAFGILNKGADYGNPVQTVCVDTAKLCKRKEFDDNFPFLLNMHANITNVKVI